MSVLCSRCKVLFKNMVSPTLHRIKSSMANISTYLISYNKTQLMVTFFEPDK